MLLLLPRSFGRSLSHKQIMTLAICVCFLPSTFPEVQTSAAAVWNPRVESQQLPGWLNSGLVQGRPSLQREGGPKERSELLHPSLGDSVILTSWPRPLSVLCPPWGGNHIQGPKGTSWALLEKASVSLPRPPHPPAQTPRTHFIVSLFSRARTQDQKATRNPPKQT